MKTLMKEKLLETTTEEVGRGRVSEEGRADRSDEGVQRVGVEVWEGGSDRGAGVFLAEGLLSAACSLKNGAKGAEAGAI